MLSNIEELVMGVVWNTKEILNSQKILQGIIATYQEKPSTNDLAAALCNLEDKAFLAVKNMNGCNYYIPLLERDIYVRTLYKGMAARFYAGDEEEMYADIRKEDSTIPDNDDFTEMRREGAREAIEKPDKSPLDTLRDMFG